MELTDLLKMASGLIQGNNDDATTGLDADDITNALSKLSETVMEVLILAHLLVVCPKMA